MYTRRTSFPLKPDNTDEAIEMGTAYGKVIHDLPGHLSTVMYVDQDTFTSITTWDTEEHAVAVAATRDDAQRDLVDLLAGAPSTSIAATIVHDIG